jgi:hypothetical protein
MSSILLEMELAALPGDAREVRSERLAEAGMVVTDDEGDAMEAAVVERAQEVAPVDMSFGEGDVDAENGACSRGVDANGEEDGGIDDLIIAANLFVAGIEDEKRVSDGVERPVAPELELVVELSGGAADLRGRDLQRARELREDGRDTASRDALDVHLGDGESQGAFAAEAALQSRRIEVDLAANLGNLESDLAETCLERLFLKAIGVAPAGGGALVRSSPEDLGAFNLHGMVEQNAHGLSEAVRALGANEVYDLIERVRVALGMGHFGAFCLPKPNKPMWPIPVTSLRLGRILQNVRYTANDP